MSDNPDVQAVVKLARKAPPLPEPSGRIVRVKDAGHLLDAIEKAERGTTILIADGRYELPRDILLTQDDVTIRSESGVRESVLLDGMDNAGKRLQHYPGAPAMLRIKRSQNARIAGVTFYNSPYYGIIFYGDSGIRGLSVYDVKFHNIWVRGLKGTAPQKPDDQGSSVIPPEQVEKVRASFCELRYCLFVVDHKKTKGKEEDSFEHDYISGTDMMGLNHWCLADNVFVGIRGKNGYGRGAIFLWHGCDHCVVERNIVVNCDRGICFGNGSGKDVSMRHGVIRDNVLIAGANRAIECCTTRHTHVYNNRIMATQFEWPTISFLMKNHGSRFHHNLVHGDVTTDPTVMFDANHIGRMPDNMKDPREVFVNPDIGDLSLTQKGLELYGNWMEDPGATLA